MEEEGLIDAIGVVVLLIVSAIGVDLVVYLATDTVALLVGQHTILHLYQFLLLIRQGDLRPNFSLQELSVGLLPVLLVYVLSDFSEVNLAAVDRFL